MNIKAIVTDLDDTLLNPEGKLSPYTVEVFHKAKQQGIKIIPASGRAAFSMLTFVRQLDTGLPYIAYNGAQLINADHTVKSSIDFDPQKAKTLIRYLKQNDFYVHCYRGEDFYFDKDSETSAAYAASSGMHGHAVGDLAAFIDFATPKLLSVQVPDTVAAFYPKAQADFPDVYFTISKPYFLELQPSNVSKGAAVRKLAQQLDLQPETTLVFGDSLNDLSMLSYAVNSVAMGNARDEVKQETRFVCGSNAEDGVARFIAENVLA